MKVRILTIAAALLSLLMVTACGQKGPLYIPTEEPAATTTR